MGKKVMREGLIWPALGVLLSAALVVALAGFLFAQSNGAVYRKSVGLEMSWKRGDNHYGPNFIHLESACPSNPEPGCFCSLDFKTTTSKEFADYVESFGSNRVPVKFHVDYDSSHQVVGAILEGVGEWSEERFHINERSLSTGFRSLPNRRTSSGHFNNPADCFPKSVKYGFVPSNCADAGLSECAGHLDDSDGRKDRAIATVLDAIGGGGYASGLVLVLQ